MFTKRILKSVAIAAMASAVTISSLGLASAQQNRPRYNSRQSSHQSWTIPPDTIITVQMNSPLSSKTSRVGDRFNATVTVPVYVNGETAIPAGSVIEGRVTQVTPARRMSKPGTIGIGFELLIFPDGSRLPLIANLTSDDPETRSRIDEESTVSGEERDKAVFVGGGGAIGAVIGVMTGGGKGAVVGGVLGAGAGVAGVLLSKGEEARVPTGTPFGVQLREPLVVNQDSTNANMRRSDTDVDQIDNDQPPVSVTRPESRSETRRETGPPARDSEPVDPGDPPRSDDIDIDKVPEESREPEKAEPVLPLSSPEMIRRAQTALKYEGYYEGPEDGVMTARVSTALKTYQREKNLPQTGDLDPQTAGSLGIMRASTPAAQTTRNDQRTNDRQKGDRPQTTPVKGTANDRINASDIVPATVLSASARRMDNGAIYILINTQANTGGWRWFGEHVVNGDTLEVYARAKRPTGMVTQALTRGKIELNVTEKVTYVQRVVIHSAGPDQEISLRERQATTPQTSPPVSRFDFLKQGEALLSEFERLSGLRISGGVVESNRNAQNGEAEMEMLFALDGFVNSARLYTNITASMRGSGNMRPAVLAFAKQARRTDKVIATSTSRFAGQLSLKWDVIRQDVLRLIQNHGIRPSDLED
jgi:peptidoglycan hydrolase-like protein with peptidoglycan-binding domain